MLAVLGTIEFSILNAPGSMEGRFGVDYAEHALINRKPRLQQMGERLDEWNLALQFHWTFCEPQAQIDQLRAAQVGGRALAFVLANGVHHGYYVITEISQVAQQLFPDGTLLAATVNVSLREFPTRGLPVFSSDAPAVRRLGGYHSPIIMRRATPMVTEAAPKADTISGSPTVRAFRTALTAARQGAAAYRNARDLIAAARAITTNPGLAIQRALGAGGALVRLVGLEGEMQALAPFASKADVAAALSLGTQVASVARGTQGRLAGMTNANYAGRLGAVANDLGNIGTTFEAADAPLARLTARTATRSATLGT